MDDLDRAPIASLSISDEADICSWRGLAVAVLSEGFLWEGKRVPLIGPQGVALPTAFCAFQAVLGRMSLVTQLRIYNHGGTQLHLKPAGQGHDTAPHPLTASIG